jgi:hypothetical protein
MGIHARGKGKLEVGGEMRRIAVFTSSFHVAASGAVAATYYDFCDAVQGDSALSTDHTAEP